MKVALLNESFPPIIDGVSNCVYNYAKFLTKNHCKAMVITPKQPGTPKDNYTFPVCRYSSFNMGKKLGYRVGNVVDAKAYKTLVKEKFDLLHIHSPFASSVVAALSLIGRKKVPVVITYHTKFDIDIKKRISSKVMQKISMGFLLRNLNRADEVWTVSKGAGESLRNIGYKKPYRVMENGTDFAIGKAPDCEVVKIKKKYGLDKADVTFLFVGRMMWYKNIRLILDALSLCKNIKFKMIFVGDGHDRKSIEEYTKRCGLQKRVAFTGEINDREKVRAFFSAADLFLFPSTYDTSGLVVKEAAACSLPTLLVEGSCAAEGVTHNENGFLCKENITDMSRAIKEIYENKEKLKEVGDLASETVYLSWEDAVEKAYKRYEKIIKNFERK